MRKTSLVLSLLIALSGAAGAAVYAVAEQGNTQVKAAAQTAAAADASTTRRSPALPPGYILKAGRPLNISMHPGAALIGERVAPPAAFAASAPLAARPGSAVFFGDNVRVNGAALDTVQTLPGTRPFVNTSHADASLAAHGADLVSVFSSSGAEVAATPQGGFAFLRNQQVAYAHSHDAGRTWSSAYLPPLPGSTWTGGFPQFTIGHGIVDVDRRGNFHVGGLGRNAQGQFAITLNTSTDRGRTFAEAKQIDTEGRVEKQWLAVGPDPVQRQRDNVYLSWVSFNDAAGFNVLRFARSTDGGANFEVKTIFAPQADPNPSNPQNFIQYPTMAVDQSSGKLYLAFLQFGFVSDDYLRILVSDDGGDTFAPVKFNRPGAPNPEVYPVIQPGTLTECGAVPSGGGLFAITPLTLHAGPDVGGALTPGLPRYVRATRMFLQPAIAASKGLIHLTWSNSTSTFYADPASGANILHLRSDDDGATWSPPRIVNTVAAGSERNVTPAIALGRFAGETALPLPSPRDVHISYYTQRSDGSMVMNLARSRDRGASFPAALKRQLSSTAFELAPTNVPLPVAGNPYQTTNYNRLKPTCTSLGDYTGLSVGLGTVHAAWSDSRASFTQPVDALDPISGQTHPKEDVYYRKSLILP